MNYKLLTVATLAALSSCATPPKATVFKNSETFSVTKDQAWEKLLAFFTSNNVQIKTIEKDSGVIYAERSGVDATYADCGQGGLAVDVSRSGTLNVFVREVSAGKTQVTVNTDFKIMRQFDGQPIIGECKSTGSLERGILSGLGTPAT
ncbi:hypothetical protein [Rhizobium rhizogenes]|uniref:hypothetical protein n=1 Tax=Rhizobium rhizogenes TaxID=359 RepID=UPI0024BE517B|nr:hypothetical protein [Rhizobium rhizogenes]MDJ1632246.1 hypothetical protein [Rhizobium rhizogenes]